MRLDFTSFLLRSRDIKEAMSQETGLEVPRCWPQYKRMLLVRAICIDTNSVGALSTAVNALIFREMADILMICATHDFNVDIM